MWQLRSLQDRMRRAYLLRGGKVIKLEYQSLAGDRYVTWVETQHANVLTEVYEFKLG